MSRLSRANFKARESVFAGGPDLYRGDIQAICPPNLAECVMAAEDCCEEVREVPAYKLTPLTKPAWNGLCRHMKHNNYCDMGHVIFYV